MRPWGAWASKSRAPGPACEGTAVAVAHAFARLMISAVLVLAALVCWASGIIMWGFALQHVARQWQAPLHHAVMDVCGQHVPPPPAP
jgi:hypothetical protein